jgi:competence ComEA-like helix-hairpin-helix protein
MKGKAIFITGIFLVFIAACVFNATANGAAQGAGPFPATAKVDLNKATAEQLSKCPGINPTLAQAIVDYRMKSGLFKAPEDLLKVKGMTKEIYSKAKPKMENNHIYLIPAASIEDEEEPSLKPSKC